METKKNTPTAFQQAIQDALTPVLQKYCPKGSNRALIVASFDGEEETVSSVLCGIVGSSNGLSAAIKATIKDEAVKPFFDEAMNEIELEDTMRELFGAAEGCMCAGCVAAREGKAKGKVDPRVN